MGNVSSKNGEKKNKFHLFNWHGFLVQTQTKPTIFPKKKKPLFKESAI